MDLMSGVLLNLLFFVSLYIQVFLLLTFLEYKKSPRNKTRSPSKLPGVTIIVPCFNEAQTLYGTLRSLLALDYPKQKLAIIVVDDGSTDNTYAVAKRFEKYGNVRVLTKENGGKHTALNRGLGEAKTELVGCLDADSFVDTKALMHIVPLFESAQVMAVTPAIKVAEPKNFIEKIQYVEYIMGIFLRKMFGLLNAIHVTPGPFSIFRREVFEKLGRYREAHQTEDLEIALRMHANRLRIENAENAFVYTTVPKTLPKLLRQRGRWISGFLRNAYDYRKMFFRPRFGHIGLFTLPGGVFSILSVSYLAIYSLTTLLRQVMEKVSEWHIINFEILQTPWTFDSFFIHPTTSLLFTLTLFTVGIVVVFLGKHMVEGRARFSHELWYFLFLYGILAPLWIINALVQVILGRKAAWR